MRQTRLLKLSDIVIQKAVSSTELKKQYEINVNRQKRVTRKAGKTKVKASYIYRESKTRQSHRRLLKRPAVKR